MGTPPLRPCLVAVATCAVALTMYFAASPARSAAAAPTPAAPLEDPDWKTKGYKYTGADTCFTCHATPGVGYTTDFVKLTEYGTWKTVDKHSLAAAALRGTLGKRISMQLAKNETFVLKPEGGCLGCHSSYFPGQNEIEDPLQLTEGVSCDACHGPASAWQTEHNGKKKTMPPWRMKTVKEKHDLGMRNLRDPVERARLCSSCHIGSADEGRVVTHAMYAAGHPPLLSFEVASFSRALPPHWYEKKDVPLFDPKHKEFKAEFKDLYRLDETLPGTRLVLTGGAASLRQQFALAAGRAAQSDKWPELKLPQLADENNPKSAWNLAALAHSDCAACHHELRVPSWRAERGYGQWLLDGTLLRGKPGRPQPSLWSLPLAAIAVPPNDAKDLDAALMSLHTACDARPFGTIDNVGKAAAIARDAVNLQPVAALNPDQSAALELLKRLTTLAADRTPDFDTARQLAAAFIVIYSELKPEQANDAHVREIIAELVGQLNLFAPANLTDRFNKVAVQMEEASGKKIVLPSSPEQMQATLQKAYVEMNNQQLTNLYKLLLDPKHVDAMQALRDQELTAITRSMGDYDPARFKKQMAELNKLVGEMKPK